MTKRGKNVHRIHTSQSRMFKKQLFVVVQKSCIWSWSESKNWIGTVLPLAMGCHTLIISSNQINNWDTQLLVICEQRLLPKMTTGVQWTAVGCCWITSRPPESNQFLLILNVWEYIKCPHVVVVCLSCCIIMCCVQYFVSDFLLKFKLEYGWRESMLSAKFNSALFARIFVFDKRMLHIEM